MDLIFGPERSIIGGDILDIGSSKAQAKRHRGSIGDAMSPAPLTLGMPGQFDLPNVENVSTAAFLCRRKGMILFNGRHGRA